MNILLRLFQNRERGEPENLLSSSKSFNSENHDTEISLIPSNYEPKLVQRTKSTF